MKDLKESLKHSFTHSGENLSLSFDAQLLAALMLQSNALISIKMATKLCSISRQEIDRRIHNGTFPLPFKLSGEERSIRKAFRIRDIETWLDSPTKYTTTPDSSLDNQHNSNDKLTH